MTMRKRLLPILLVALLALTFSGCQIQKAGVSDTVFEITSSKTSNISSVSSSSDASSSQEPVPPLHEIMEEYYNGVFEEFGYSLDQYTCYPISSEDVPGEVFLYYHNNIPRIEGMTMPYVYQINEEQKYIILYQTENGENTLVTLDYSQSKIIPDVSTESSQSEPVDFRALLESSFLSEATN